MLSQETKSYFVNEIFTIHKGKIKIKNSRFTPILFKHRSQFATTEEIIAIIAEELILTIDNYKPETSWVEMSQDLNHKEWNIIKAKAYVRADKRAFKQSKNIKYSDGKLIELFIPVDATGSSSIVPSAFNYWDITGYNESEFTKWFKANRENLITARQNQFIQDLEDSAYPAEGYTTEYEKVTGRKATEVPRYRTDIRSRVLKKWNETPKGKEIADKNLNEMIEQVLQMDNPDFVAFVKEQMSQGTKFAQIIEDNIKGEANIELNKFVQGKGFVTLPTLYIISNILSDYVENNGSSPIKRQG